MPTADKTKEQPDQILHRGSKQQYFLSSSHNVLMDEMQTQVAELCSMLDQSSSDESFDCSVWVQHLEAYIEDYNNRLLYSAISSHIFGKSEKEFDTFLGNLDKVMEYATTKIRPHENESDEKRMRLYRMIVKFYDHVNLANQQQLMFTDNREGLRQQISSELEPKISEAAEELTSQLSEATKDLTSQLIGLVALFTALSFIVFGGISSLDNLLDYLNEQKSVLPSLIIAVAWAFCLMNLLFGFMYFVLRVAKISPLEENAKNLVQQYPIVFLCNYILLLLFAVFCGMWFAVCNGIGSPIFQYVVNHSIGTFIIAIVVFVIAFLGLGWKLWTLYKAS